MLKRHFILAKRLLLKYPLNTIINLMGLTLGLAGFLLLSLYVYDEHQTDRFHENYEDIYHVSMRYHIDDDPMFSVPPPAGLFNDLDQVTGVISYSRGFTAGLASVEIEDEKFYERGGIFVDSAWLEIFDFQYLNDNFDFATDPSKVAISEVIADKYFGNEDPVGKLMAIDDEQYLVDNIILKPEGNSSIVPAFLISYQKQKAFGIDLNSYKNGHAPYWLVTDRPDSDLLRGEIQALIDTRLEDSGFKVEVTPMSDFYFGGDTYYDKSRGAIRGNKKYYNVFASVAIVLLVLAVINYINLNTARATGRAKEVGVKKTIGARPSGLIVQFLMESLLVTFIAGLLAVGLLELSLPAFNSLLTNSVSQHYLLTPEFVVIYLGLIFFIGFIAGIYPAFVLSSFKPTKVLKGNASTGKGSAWVRNMLITIQFAVATLLVFGCLVIQQQMTFITDYDLGIESEQLIAIKATDEAKKQFNLIKQDYLQLNGVAGVSRGDLPVIGMMYATEIKGQTANVAVHHVDEEFLMTAGVTLLEGRNFKAGDSKDQVIINRTLRDLYFGDEPTVLGDLKDNVLIGVVEDFYFSSTKGEVRPLELKMHENDYREILVRIEEGANMRIVVDGLKTDFDKHAENSIFEYAFLDEEYDNHFKSEILFLKLLNYFTYLSIVIGTIGLFGLAQFSFIKKTKELGIRKILGAPMRNIFRIMIKELFKPIVVAAIIGLPLGYYLLNDWLQDFTNRISLNGWFFFYTLMIVGLIGLVAIFYQIIRAIRINPIDVIRDE